MVPSNMSRKVDTFIGKAAFRCRGYQWFELSDIRESYMIIYDDHIWSVFGYNNPGTPFLPEKEEAPAAGPVTPKSLSVFGVQQIQERRFGRGKVPAAGSVT